MWRYTADLLNAAAADNSYVPHVDAGYPQPTFGWSRRPLPRHQKLI
jgi:hypothetical protein